MKSFALSVLIMSLPFCAPAFADKSASSPTAKRLASLNADKALHAQLHTIGGVLLAANRGGQRSELLRLTPNGVALTTSTTDVRWRVHPFNIVQTLLGVPDVQPTQRTTVRVLRDHELEAMLQQRFPLLTVQEIDHSLGAELRFWRQSGALTSR